MKLAILDGARALEPDDELVELYAKEFRPIDAVKAEVILLELGVEENTDKNDDELIQIIHEGMIENIDLMRDSRTPQHRKRAMNALTERWKSHQ